jgi:DNA (cytosine-5)-methyltransferase 1
MKLTSLEICAGAGGQAIGLEQAGFEHVALIEQSAHCCATLRLNRPNWNVIQADVNVFDGRPYKGVDLLCGGVPCPPFSIAGKQLGRGDERDLFPAAIRLVDEIRPNAVFIENVKGLKERAFDDYRQSISKSIQRLGYLTDWRLLNASEFGVPQLRPRFLFVALRKETFENFQWPEPLDSAPLTVGEVLSDLMSVRGWKGLGAWKKLANDIAPTIVGGSLKHGGPDLGPTRARQAWAKLGVDGLGIADLPPEKTFVGMPRLTVPMVARLQGFPDSWTISGGKTAAYRQVGNAFPAPVAKAVGKRLFACLTQKELEYAS